MAVRRTLLLLCLVLVSSGLAAGCFGEEGGGSSKSDRQAQQDQGEESTPAPTGEKASKGGETTEKTGGGSTKGDTTAQASRRGLQRVEPGVVVYGGGTGFVNPLAQVYGAAFVGGESYVASNTVLRADEGQTVEIGDGTNVQDNASVRALRGRTTVGDRTSIARNATVEDSGIGDSAYVGFNAEVVDSTLGNGAVVMHGARVEGVEVPEGAFVQAGQVVTDQESADSLGAVPEEIEALRSEESEANAELARAYVALFEEEGEGAVNGIGPNPGASPNARSEPDVSDEVILGDFARIVGDVEIGNNANLGDRISIKAEGDSPIEIGGDAIIEDRVSLYAPAGTPMELGDRVLIADDSVLHDLPSAGDNLRIGENSVLSRMRVGSNVTIGQNVIVAGPLDESGEPELEITNGITIPDGSVVTTQEELEAILVEQD